MNKPLVTLFVMSFNQAPFIREAVQSALRQTYEPLEIIFSDDCSHDNTYEIILMELKDYSGIHTVKIFRNEENMGIVPHIEHINKIASGELIIQMGGDDISREDRVQIIVDKWEKSRRKALLLHSAVTEIDVDGNELNIKMPRKIVDYRTSPINFIHMNMYVIGATEAWNPVLFQFFGSMADIVSLEDRALPFRALLLGQVAFIDEPLVSYRIGGVSSLPPSFAPEEQERRHLRYLRWYQESYSSYSRDLEKVDFISKQKCLRMCKERMYFFQIASILKRENLKGKIRCGGQILVHFFKFRNIAIFKLYLKNFF